MGDEGSSAHVLQKMTAAAATDLLSPPAFKSKAWKGAMFPLDITVL